MVYLLAWVAAAALFIAAVKPYVEEIEWGDTARMLSWDWPEINMRSTWECIRRPREV